MILITGKNTENQINNLETLKSEHRPKKNGKKLQFQYFRNKKSQNLAIFFLQKN